MELFLEGYGQEVCRIWKAELYCIVTSTTAMRVLNVCCINAAVETTQARHPILSNGYGSIQIDGFSGLIPKKCFCIMADGHRYQEHGISTGSVLFCQRAAEINDGDLIVVKENGAFALYLYLKDRKVKADGKKRILHNKSKAYAKVLGSFNFYH